MSEPSISELLSSQGIQHERDANSGKDYKHALYDKDGKCIGRFDASEACELLKQLVVMTGQRNLGRPRIEDAANSFEATKPWLALGWSRSTWYRRQAEKRKEQAL
jgi:hypothetical protein